MADLIVSPSMVQSFIDSCESNYSAILYRCRDIEHDLKLKYKSVEDASSHINIQISKIYNLIDVLKKKISTYEVRVLEAEADVEKCDAQINFVYHHQMMITNTDSAGNKHTTYVIDPVALSAAREAKQTAERLHSKWKENVGEAEHLLKEVEDYSNTLENLRSGIEAAANSMERDIYEISKLCDAIYNEEKHNIDSLKEAMHKINAYSSCKRFYAPSTVASFTEYSKSKR